MAIADRNLASHHQQRTAGTRPFGWDLFWGSLAIVSLPMMIPYLSHLWSIDSYRFFPFAFLAAGGLLYARWDREFHPPQGWLGWLAIGFGFLCITLGVLLPTKWLAAVGFVTFAGVFLRSARGPADRNLLALVLPLVLLIRLPLGYDQLLVIQLQRITSGLASVCLDLLAIPHAVANNVITLVSRELFVAEACSGIQSVFTLAFISILLVVFHRRPIWLAPIYVAIAILLAIAANTIRVTSVAVGEAWFSLDWATGWSHELIGYLALGAAALFLLSFDHLIVSVMHPVDPHGDVPLEENPLIRVWNFLLEGPVYEDADEADASDKSAGMGGQITGRVQAAWHAVWPRRIFLAAVLLLTLGTVVQAFKMQRPPLINQPTELVFDPPENIFTNRFDSIRITGHEQMRGNSDPRLGENADIWRCEINGIDVESELVLSQPYYGWHELCICYEAGNWNVLNREVLRADDEDASEESFEPLAVARFKREPGTYAYLLYSAFDPKGDVLVPPERPGRLGTRFRDLLYGGEQFERENVMMLQLFVVVPNKLDPDLLRSLTSDFIRIRATLLDQLFEGRTPPEESGVAEVEPVIGIRQSTVPIDLFAGRGE